MNAREEWNRMFETQTTLEDVSEIAFAPDMLGNDKGRVDEDDVKSIESLQCAPNRDLSRVS
ncbi:hypothetical protein D9758_016835 [Tetrapyrgos nigripes]|uniref:Uncharacterized protein n=1 Tax=Tetrapyrgos nigripes TaxID=182062 RepID=A0A8H5CBN9_9AGAR|nr:hypothetical protein D9758_016835 [Tetrapyrgos nigripes]